MNGSRLLSSWCILVILVAGCSKPAAPTPTATNLHQAALNYPDQISVLIENGARIDELDDDGVTALWKAVLFGKVDSIRPLLIAGADPDAPGQRGWTPLHCDSFCNRGEEGAKMAVLLLEYGADPNAVAPEYGETALHYAVMWQSAPVVRVLLSYGADVNAESFTGQTALQLAVVKGDTTIAELLLDSGADPKLRNKHGIRPIDQLNVCPNPTTIQDVFRAHDADDERRPELFRAHRRDELGKETAPP